MIVIFLLNISMFFLYFLPDTFFDLRYFEYFYTDKSLSYEEITYFAKHTPTDFSISSRSPCPPKNCPMMPDRFE